MTVLRINIKYLERKTKLKKNEIIDCLELVGFPTEIEENNFWIEITPNRPDCYLVEGIIRVINSFVNLKNKIYKKENDPDENKKYLINVNKNVKKTREFISACVIKGLNINSEELEWLIDAQEKIHETVGRNRKKIAIGIHNLDILSFPLEYKIVNKYSFVPLGFDEEMNIEDILIKHPKGKKYAHLIKKGEYPIIFEKNGGGVVSFPPIINADMTKLKKGTKNIFIEITGTHKETVENTINILACSLADLGGKIYPVKINNEIHPKLEYKEEEIKIKKINGLLGKEFTEEEVGKYLKKMGYFILKKENKKIIKIPPYRNDILNYVDIIEDVAIGFGYENFDATIPNIYTVGKYDEITKRENKIREILNGMGFLEIVTQILGKNESKLKIINPCNEEYKYVRENLFDSSMKTILSNKMKGVPQKIYEIGKVYENKLEKNKLAMAIIDKKVDFNKIRGVLQTYMREIGSKYMIEKKERNEFENGKCGVISFGKGKDKKEGIVGIINEEYRKKIGIEFEIGYCELEI